MSHGCDSDIVPFVAHDIAYSDHREDPPNNDLWKILNPEVWVDLYGTPEENAKAFCPTVRGWTVSEEHSTFGKKGRIYINWITKGEPLLDWKSAGVPEVLRTVVDACVEMGAYQPFNNVTVGHFGFKTREHGVLWSSRRKQNFNIPSNRDLVQVEFGPDSQTAHGAKPSAGARSQYIVLSRYDDLDCIVHFHCPKKEISMVPVRSQREFECGSHQCGKNTADGMVRVNDNLAVVMLDKHGPNIVFSRNANPKMVIDFIKANFDLGSQTQ